MNYSNTALTAKQTLVIAIICYAVSFVTFSSGLINAIKTNSYVTVEAKILNTITESNDDSESNYCIYEFQFENKTHTIKKQIFSIGKRETGKYENIRINPNNPQEFNDDFKYTICYILGVFTLLVAAVLTKSLERFSQ